MERTEAPSHRWFSHRLEALAAGILDPAEELPVRTHLAECAECHEALEAMRLELAEAGSGHVPSSVLAEASVEPSVETARAVRRSFAPWPRSVCRSSPVAASHR